jgi:hypothetical protein
MIHQAPNRSLRQCAEYEEEHWPSHEPVKPEGLKGTLEKAMSTKWETQIQHE